MKQIPMNTDKQEVLERLSIAKAYHLYFKYANCSQYTVSEINTSNRIDAIISSGDSKIVVEWKNRNYTLGQNTWSSTMIEYTKFKYLADVVKWSGCTSWYVNQFEDYIMIYDVKRITEREHNIPLNHYFYWDRQPKDNYSGAMADKYVRLLPFHEAALILDRQTYQPITYKTLLNNLISERQKYYGFQN
jgi:hypothetical protein